MIRHLNIDELDCIIPALTSVQAVHHEARPDLFRSPDHSIVEAKSMLAAMMKDEGLTVLVV